MDFQTVLKTQCNVWDFSPQDIPDPVLNRILEAARIASTAFHLQPWRFVIVQDETTKTQLAEMCKGQTFVATASAVVVCCGQKYHNPYNWLGENFYLIDVAAATAHLQLAARHEGVGSCWIAAFDHEPIKKLLQVPADYEVIMLVPLGYPASEEAFHPTTECLALEQIVFTEKFGHQWTKSPQEIPPAPKKRPTPSLGLVQCR